MTRKNSIDYGIIIVLVGLCVISLLAVYSGTGQYTDGQSFYFVKRQLIWYIVSFGIMILVTYFDYELLERWVLPLYLVGIGLLLYVRFFGLEKNGSQRWIELPLMDFQPTEVMKIFVILYLAVLYKKYGREKLSFVKGFILFLKTILITGIPVLLILLQPDLGSSILITVVSFGLLLMSSISNRMVVFVISLASSLIVFASYVFIKQQEWVEKHLEPHQLGRIYSWLNPSEYASNYGYQLKQAMLGIGSGRLSGAGFNQGHQVQSGRVPEAHTDFIFAAIAEEFGFIGASLIIVLYFLLIYRIIMIALQAKDLFGIYLSVGVAILLAFQVFQNIAMTIGIMPVTGIALPFISYGGSALITNMVAIGFVQSVHMRTKEYMFS